MYCKRSIPQGAVARADIRVKAGKMKRMYLDTFASLDLPDPFSSLDMYLEYLELKELS